MKKRLFPLALLILLSTNAVAKEYLGSYSVLNAGLTGIGPAQSVDMVVLSEGEIGGSAGIAVSAQFTGQTFPYSNVDEAGVTSPHLAMMFGGQGSNLSKTLATIASVAPMATIGGDPTSEFYSPTPEDIGSGLDPATTYAFSQFVSVEGLLNQNDIEPVPTNGSYEMGLLTYTFSRPVDNPILHVTGLGAFFSSSETGFSMLMSVDLELVGPYSLSRLSGSAYTVLDVGNRIKNVYDYEDYANDTPAGGGQGATGESAGSGSFLVNGNGVTSVTFKVHMVGKMTAPAPSTDIVPSYWSSLDGNNDLNGVPQTEVVQRYVGDRFTTSWTLPLEKDFGDAVDDGSVINTVARNYATDKSNDGPHHRILSGLQLGSIVDAEIDIVPSPTGLKDDETGLADEDGVSFNIVGSSLTAVVTGTNTQDRNAMLCGWLDGAADGVVTGKFDRNISYVAGEVGQSNNDPNVTTVVGIGNEELCIMVPKSDGQTQTTELSLGGDSNPAQASCEVLAGETNFSCSLTWNPNFTDRLLTFARFRLTTAEEFFSTMSPSPIGYAVDGEVEDYALDITPDDVQPDLTPVITLLPSVMVGPTNFEIFIQVVELLNANTLDTITVRIPKDGRWSHTWEPSATSLPVSGKPLNNPAWSLSEDANALIFTTTTTILGGSQLNFGFPAVWNAGQTIGSFTASVVIVSGSGAEVRVDNNTDAEQADYSFE